MVQHQAATARTITRSMQYIPGACLSMYHADAIFTMLTQSIQCAVHSSMVDIIIVPGATALGRPWLR